MSNLPNVAQLTFPASDLSTKLTTQNPIHATYDWDFDAGDFRLSDGKLVTVTGLDYIKIWVKKALLTVKGTLIYSGSSYGSEYYSLIGQNFHPDFEKAELTRMISEAILQNDAITAVESFAFSQTGSRLTISFTVQSIYGTASDQVVI